MIVIGTDTHKKTHTCGAVNALTAAARDELTVPARKHSFGKLLVWARKLDPVPTPEASPMPLADAPRRWPRRPT